MQLIAEFGQSHLGNLERAKSQIVATAGAGWTAAKFQMFDPSRLCGPSAVRYWDKRLGGAESQEETFRRNGDLTSEEWWELAAFAETQGVEFMATPFDLEAVDTLQEMGVGRYKVASADITYERLLTRIRATGRPVLLSTGGACLAEIAAAVKLLWGSQVTLLACSLDYPTAQADAHLARIAQLKEEFPWLEVGYSDHTIGVNTATAAAALGATVLEKHCTVGRDTVCPDDELALSVDQMRRYREFAQAGHLLRGSRHLTPHPGELEAIAQARRSAHFTRDLPAGHRIAADDLIYKRPEAGGFPPNLEGLLVGKKLVAPVSEGDQADFANMLLAD